MDFQVPDDYPEDKIPKFSTLKDFDTWYRKQNFKPYQVTKIDEDKVVDFPFVNSDLKNTFNLLSEIEKNQDLIDGDGFPETIALSITPEGYLRDISKTILPTKFTISLKLSC